MRGAVIADSGLATKQNSNTRLKLRMSTLTNKEAASVPHRRGPPPTHTRRPRRAALATINPRSSSMFKCRQDERGTAAAPPGVWARQSDGKRKVQSDHNSCQDKFRRWAMQQQQSRRAGKEERERERVGGPRAAGAREEVGGAVAAACASRAFVFGRGRGLRGSSEEGLPASPCACDCA